MSRQPLASSADPDGPELERVREAERRRAVALSQLAERESQLAALRQRIELSEQLSSQASQALRAELGESVDRRLDAERRLEQATAEVAAADAALAQLRERVDALARERDVAAARAATAEREREASLADAADDRGRLLARIARLEQQVTARERPRPPAATGTDVDELVAELARAGAELEAARSEIERLTHASAGDELDAARREIARLTATASEERGAARREIERLTQAVEQARREAAAAVDRRGAGREAATTAAAADRPAAAGTNAELERRLRALRDERDAIERAGRVSRAEHIARIRELEQLVSTLSLTLAATRDDVDRAERSRAWRLGHGVSRTAARVARRPDRTDGALSAALRRIEEVQRATRALPSPPDAMPAVVGPPPAVDPAVKLDAGKVAEQRRMLAADVRLRLGPPPELDAWPAVSIVVVSRNGLEHLRRLVDGLVDATDYPELELVVVDNGSQDGTAEWLQAVTGLALRHVANAENVSYSHANNQGAQLAAHPLLLFLNNDIQPFERGWLRELVASHVLGGQAITGATLLHTERTRRSADGRLVQHRAIRLRRTPAGVLPYNDGDGAALLGPGFGVEQQALAVSGACLMIAAATLEQLGGWSLRYRYGLEDVDLGLRARRAGQRAVTSGRAMLYHEESATRVAEGPDFTRATRETNRRALQEMWGPQLRRTYQRARLAGDPAPTDGAGPCVALTVTSDSPADGWGDWYTANELGDALAALGWRVEYVAVGRGDAPLELPAGVDYVITLLDRFDARTVPAEVGVIAWIRNWTDRWLERPWFERLDLVLASSATSAALVERRTGLRPVPFPLATNPARFATATADPKLAVDCVFTGNHWGPERAIQSGLAPARGQTLAVLGKGWEKVKPLARHHRGVADYDELPAIYASAQLVLDDTQEPTLRYDAVNARVFDALAAGSLVLTNCAAGVRELFDDDFPVWSDAPELRAQRAALLADDGRRRALADRYREIVLTRHTYAHRAQHLVELLREREALPSFCIKIGAPDWEQAQRWGDLHFARAIERELRRRGHRCRIQVLEEWESAEGLAHDVVLHLKGLSRHHPKPGQFNVLWCISHPAELTAEECDGYDLVAIASEPFAEHMRSRTSTPVIVLEQATDPRVFYPDPDPDPSKHHDLVYVANSRNVLRPILRDLLPTELDLAVYGANWDGLIDTKHVVAEHVPNDELRRVYSSAKVVLADHWDDMREHGFVSNRIYDALACGAMVISDDVAGLSERFGGAVATYRNPDDLRALVTRALGEPLTASPAPSPPAFAERVEALVDAIATAREPR